MAWPHASNLLRDLVDWEHAQTLPGGHWPWDTDVLPFEGIQYNAATPVAVIDGARVSTRRALWIAVWGDLPDDVDLTASCAVPSCVRPAHGHVLPIAGRRPVQGLHDDVPLALLRWDAAWGGRGAERRGRLDLLGRHVPVEERRRAGRSGIAHLLELLDLGERPAR